MRSLLPTPRLPGVFTAVLGACVCAGACSKPHSAADGEVPPTVVLRGVTVSQYAGEERIAFGRADQAAYLRGDAVMVAWDAGVRLEGGGAGHGMVVAARRLDGNLSEKQTEGIGEVHVTTQNGLDARTERAHFDGQRMTVHGPQPVTVRGPGGTLTAESFELDLADQAYSFDGGVTLHLERR